MKLLNGLFGLGRISSSAAKAPSSIPSATTERTVFPSHAHWVIIFSTSGGTVTLPSVKRRGPPTMTLLPFTRACAPRPGRDSKSVVCSVGKFRCLASATTAFASGCSEFASTAAAAASRSLCYRPARSRLLQWGVPRVSVPVLSKITMFRLRARSSGVCPSENPVLCPY